MAPTVHAVLGTIGKKACDVQRAFCDLHLELHPPVTLHIHTSGLHLQHAAVEGLCCSAGARPPRCIIHTATCSERLHLQWGMNAIR